MAYQNDYNTKNAVKKMLKDGISFYPCVLDEKDAIADATAYFRMDEYACKTLVEEAYFNDSYFALYDFQNLFQALKQTRGLAGSYVEIGVYRGTSAMAATDSFYEEVSNSDFLFCCFKGESAGIYVSIIVYRGASWNFCAASLGRRDGEFCLEALEMYDVIIIGAGITGITLCKKLREKGIDNLLMLEAESNAGGLCRTKVIDGHVLDTGGGHFFHTKYQEVYDYVFRHIPEKDFNYFRRVSKIALGNETIDYPVESNIWQLPREKMIEYLISIVRNGEAQGKKEPHNYEEWIRWKLGDKICEQYMLPYNQKLWGMEPSGMDIDWLHKIPQVNVEEIIGYCLDKKQDVSKFPAHIHFYYPKKGGFQSIVDAIAKDEMGKIVFQERVTDLHREKDGWVINGKYKAASVINTTPWNDLYQALNPPAELRDAFGKIRYNRLMVSLCSHPYQNDWHWRYIPDTGKRYHREFYIGNYALDSRKDGIYVESNLERHEANLGVMDYDVIVEFKTAAAYPIPVIGHKQAIEEILAYYKPLRLYGVGRWGEHDYLNADVCIQHAIHFAEHWSRETGK